MDSMSQNSVVNGEFRRRLSPRLHKNLESHNDGNSPLVPRRFSTRFQKDSANEQLKEKSNGSSTSLETPIKRRLSPRLHCEQAIEKKKKVVVDTPKQKKKAVEATPKQRRLSPRLHCKSSLDGFHIKKESMAKSSKHGHPTCTSNGEANGEATHQLNLVKKLCASKAEKQADIEGKSDHARVKDTLRLFNTYYLQFVQEKDEREKKKEIDGKRKDKASTSMEEDVKRISSRPDLKALTKMHQEKKVLYPEKTIGRLPGIDVGYQFYSRAEMVAIGFHSHWLNGIDFIGKTTRGKGEDYLEYTLPIAVAVVLSGQYEDNMDNSDDIIYTGEGGNDLLGNKLQRDDQVMKRGNLALKNSMDQSVPIRVIRGHKNADSYSGKMYTFDGLYKVAETWADKGCRGHLVYKYRLKRLAGQPKLTTDQVQFVRGRPAKVVSELLGLVCRDISNGLEDICIPVTNIVDDPPVGPPEFTYMTSIEVASSVKLPSNSTGCSCRGNCSNPNTCACAKLNGSDFPYVRRDGGRLVEAKDVVFECGPNCGCTSECLNRISQRGIKYRLEVYRTPDKGWAVRSWDFIPSGAPVCEYIGVLRRSDELDHIAGNEYIFEIDCLHTINEIEGRERRFGNVSMSFANALTRIDKKMLDGSPEFCLDAISKGNVARFINHSCEPNLFVQCILSEHHDLRLARVVLIAADNISPMQELTYDYGFALDSVVGPDGKIKVLPCFCGTDDCRKRLY